MRKKYTNSYYENNKDKLKEYGCNYYQEHKEKALAYQHKYYHDNIEHYKKYREENRDRISRERRKKRNPKKYFKDTLLELLKDRSN